MKPFDVLDPTLNIFGHHLLEASAGTGKTFAIENLFIRLVEKSVPIDQILVVTFTRAATKELKNRIRTKLENGGICCDFDKAKIFTIHGFCYRMLKNFAFEANAGFDLRDPDDDGKGFAQKNIVFDFLRAHVTEDSYKAEELVQVLKENNGDIHKLVNRLISLMEKRKKIEGNSVMLRMAKECASFYEKKQQSSPDDLLHKMKQCLENPHFVSLVKNSFRAVIIDEFQDTDPIQWEIFQKLFYDVETLYLVGDPKQSIYRFRGSDLHTYFKAKDFIKNHWCLDTNYRSDPLLVESLNAFFPNYAPVKARTDVQSHPFKDNKGALHFFVVEAESKRARSWPPKSVEEEYLFPFIAEEIITLHQKEAFTLDSMAVLVKDRHQAERLSTYLHYYNIPCQLSRNESASESLGFSALKDLASLLLDLNDTGKLRAVLAGPFFNWEHKQLKDENLLDEMKTTFYGFYDIFQKKGFAHFIREFKIVDDSFSQLVELLLQKEAKAQMTREDLYLFLQEIERQDEESISLKNWVRPGELQVMTMHKSKGLEFAIVFALGVASRQSKEEEFATIDDKIIAYDANNPLCALHTQEQDAEKLRQLYVALTRAKNRVYVPWVLDIDNKLIRLGTKSPIELAYPDFTIFNHTLLNGKSFALTQLKSEQSEIAVQKELPVSHASSFLYSFSSLAHKGGKEKVESMDLLPAGKETGIILHSLFERLFINKLKDQEAIVEQLIQNTPLADWKDKIIEMAYKSLNLELVDGWSLNSIDLSKVFQEAEFVYPTQDNLLKGSVDLIFQKEGVYYILDWKSNLLHDYTKASMEKEMKDNDYFLQADIYTTALKRYVKLFDKDFKFGGAFYLFLRGPAVYHFMPQDNV